MSNPKTAINTTEVVGVAARIQALLATTKVVTPRAAVPPEVAAGIVNDLRKLCAARAVETFMHNDNGQTEQDVGDAQQQRLLLDLCAVAEIVLAAARQLRRDLNQRAYNKKLSQPEIAKVCGVTQQAIAKRLQPRL